MAVVGDDMTGQTPLLGGVKFYFLEFKLINFGKKMKKLLIGFLLFTSATAFSQNYSGYNWTSLPVHSAYIDLSRLEGDKVFGFKATVLLSFDEISSAQMWGLSSIDEIKIDCNKGSFQYLKSTWTEKPMARGKIAKVFNSPQKNPKSIRDVLDGSFERDLFKYLCK